MDNRITLHYMATGCPHIVHLFHRPYDYNGSFIQEEKHGSPESVDDRDNVPKVR